MNADELKGRTKGFAGQIIRFVDSFPKGTAFDVIGRQLIRSATSVAANYRAVCRARSRPDFVNKLGIVLEEADETLFWLEMLTETHKMKQSEIEPLKLEANELVSIFAASAKTARTNRKP